MTQQDISIDRRDQMNNEVKFSCLGYNTSLTNILRPTTRTILQPILFLLTTVIQTTYSQNRINGTQNYKDSPHSLISYIYSAAAPSAKIHDDLLSVICLFRDAIG